MFDSDDPQVYEVTPLLSKEQWYVFRMTWPSQLFWFCVYVAAALIFFAATARAQLAIHPDPPQTAVCVDKKDAYALALADMKGDLSTTWYQFVAQGRCRQMPASYLYTIDTYKDNDQVPSRVVELLAFGERVWGIRSTLPKGVWTL